MTKLAEKTELSSEKLEKTRRALHTKRKQLFCLVVEVARLQEREKELALRSQIEPLEPLFLTGKERVGSAEKVPFFQFLEACSSN